MGRFSGGRYCQKLPNYNRGAGGGHFAPPACTIQVWRVVQPVWIKSVQNTIYYQIWRSWSDNSYRFWFFAKKPKFHQKWPERKKNTKIVRMTSYSQYGVSKKSPSQKYKILIFGTNEGDFGGILVKIQKSTKLCYEFSKFINSNNALFRWQRVLSAVSIRFKIGRKMDLL